MSNRTIEAILRLSSKLGNMAAFRQLSGHLDKVDRQARDFNRRQSMIAAGARDMHAMLLRYAAPAALAYGVKQAFVDFAELERRMTRIGITAGASAAETREAFDTLQRSAKDFALPVDEAVNGLDTLVSSGMSLKEAMAFLPSVLATAQAAGASTADIANTAQKASSALKIQAEDMQRAFDIMVTGGKAGQFELKDMAAYIPELANSFASLGYQGEEGLKELVAVLQTIREDTGSAGAAATQAQNIFGKMFSAETGKKFAEFGINLRESLGEAKRNGEGVLNAFVRLSKEAVDGDLSKLPLLFTDQEFRLGMQSLMTSADSYKRFVDTVNGSEVDGSTMRDLGRVLEDNQTKIDRMSASWNKLKTSVGGAVAGPAGGAMDYVSDSTDYAMAVNAGLEKSGVKGFAARSWWGITHGQEEKDSMAWVGGYRSAEQRQAIEAYGKYAQSRTEAPDSAVGSIPVPTPRPGHAPVVAAAGVPVPTPRPDPREVARPDPREVAIRPAVHPVAETPRPVVEAPRPVAEAPRPVAEAPIAAPRQPGWRDKIKAANAGMRGNYSLPKFGDQAATPAPSFREPEVASIAALGRDGGQIASEIEGALSSGGADAGRAISDAARTINEAGTTGGQSFGSEAGSTFSRMLDGMAEQFGARAAASFRQNVGTVTVKAAGAGGGLAPASGVRGRTMPDAGSTPARP